MICFYCFVASVPFPKGSLSPSSFMIYIVLPFISIYYFHHIDWLWLQLIIVGMSNCQTRPLFAYFRPLLNTKIDYIQIKSIQDCVHGIRTQDRKWIHWAENTHWLLKGKYHCTADLLFDWCRFSCFVELKLKTDLLVLPNPNRSNRRSAIEWYFPLWSKWVFSALSFGRSFTSEVY